MRKPRIRMGDEIESEEKERLLREAEPPPFAPFDPPPIDGTPIWAQEYDWEEQRWVPLGSRPDRRGRLRLDAEVPVPLWLLGVLLVSGLAQFGFLVGLLLAS